MEWSFYAATKSIVSNVIPIGKEPYSEFRPNEEIGAFLAPDSILKRMVDSVIQNLFMNKVLIELKRKCEELYK